jgi:hypothetical protein
MPRLPKLQYPGGGYGASFIISVTGVLSPPLGTGQAAFMSSATKSNEPATAVF